MEWDRGQKVHSLGNITLHKYLTFTSVPSLKWRPNGDGVLVRVFYLWKYSTDVDGVLLWNSARNFICGGLFWFISFQSNPYCTLNLMYKKLLREIDIVRSAKPSWNCFWIRWIYNEIHVNIFSWVRKLCHVFQNDLYLVSRITPCALFRFRLTSETMNLVTYFGRTPWTGDWPITRPLQIHGAAQHR